MSEDPPYKAANSAAPSSFEETLDAGLASGALAKTMAENGAAPGSASVSVSDSLRPMLKWDRYEILGLLGRGGMGAVYRARDRRLGRVVALKFIRGDDEGMTRRFVQEARAQSRIDHPFVCKVHEVGEVEGKPYIAMQLVDGQPLDRAYKTMTLFEKVKLVRDVATALHTAHSQSIIHRDIKPSNIMVEKAADGSLRPVVMDFGLAREAGEGKGLTESGQVLGTPAYMSPEQARGDVRHLDHRTDVYSLGATLYDILTGKPPFDDDAIVKILIKVVNDPPLPLRAHDPKLPEALELIVSKCLNKEAAQRYPTAQALADDLERFLSAGRVVARRLGYGYRIRYFARHNRALFSLGVALSISIFCLAGFFTYTRIMSARKAAQARRQAELSRELGQEIKDLEWLMRAAYALPLHDIEREKAEVRRRMAELAERFAKLGEAGEGAETTAGLVAYGLGRGHLALHEYKQAYEQLARAEKLGTSLPELHLALGRVQGELFAKALQDARRSGDASFFEKRRQELEKQYLEPALAHLAAVKRSGARVESPRFLEGLIAFYTKHGDEALKHADAALTQDGWLYEAKKLSADVIQSRALDEKDSGQHEQAEKDFAEAIKRYEQAADIARSDHEIYEAIAESYIRQMEIDVMHGRDPQARHVQALRAADKAIEASSKDNYGYTKKAFSNYFLNQFYMLSDDQNKILNSIQSLIRFGRQSISFHMNDAYSYEIVGLGHWQMAQLEMRANRFDSARSNLSAARELFSKSISLDPRFPWAYNDQAIAYIAEFYVDLQYGNGNIAHLKSAREYLSKALQIDNKYFSAYTNLAEASRLFAQWLTEHGQDPSEQVKQAVEAATAALKINGNNPNALGVIGGAYLSQTLYTAMVGSDVYEIAQQSIAYYDKMIKINSNNVFNYGEIAFVHLLIKKYSRDANDEAIRNGRHLIEQCLKLDPKYAPCLWIEAQLIADTDWEHAHALGKQAIERALPEQAADANFALATMIYERLISASPPLPERNRLLAEGLATAKLALAQNRSWPRALALQGALAWMSAKQAPAPARRAELVRLASDSFKQAFEGNPLLKRQYEGALRELSAASSGN